MPRALEQSSFIDGEQTTMAQNPETALATQRIQEMIDAGLSHAEMDLRCDAVELIATKLGALGDHRAAALFALTAALRCQLTADPQKETCMPGTAPCAPESAWGQADVSPLRILGTPGCGALLVVLRTSGQVTIAGQDYHWDAVVTVPLVSRV